MSSRNLNKKKALCAASFPPHLSSSLHLEHFPISTDMHDNSHFYGALQFTRYYTNSISQDSHTSSVLGLRAHCTPFYLEKQGTERLKDVSVMHKQLVKGRAKVQKKALPESHSFFQAHSSFSTLEIMSPVHQTTLLTHILPYYQSTKTKLQDFQYSRFLRLLNIY